MTRIGILGKVLVVSRFSIQKKLLNLLDSGSVKIDLYALFLSAEFSLEELLKDGSQVVYYLRSLDEMTV